MSEGLVDREKSPFASRLGVTYLRYVVQALIMVLFLSSLSNFSLPYKFLWNLDPFLGVSAAIIGTFLPIEFLLFTVAMLLLATLMGRVYCGWICPLGFLQDLTSFRKNGLSIPDWARYIKYALLLGGLFTLLFSGWTFLEWISPMSMLLRAVGRVWKPERWIFFSGIALLFAVTLSVTTEKRAWCRYFCPLGALLSLTGTVKRVGIRINQEKCTKCLTCQKKCTMGIIQVKDQTYLESPSECVLCLSCKDICPTSAINYDFTIS